MGRDFPPVQTGPGAHPASCGMGTGSFPGVNYDRGVLLTTHHLLVPWSWKIIAIPLPTLWATTGPVTTYISVLSPQFGLAILDGGIGRGSPPYWPLVSRDLNPLCCYERYIKGLLYQQTVTHDFYMLLFSLNAAAPVEDIPKTIVVKYVQQDATIAFLFSAMALLYMFRATISPIIRSTYAVYGHR